MSSVLPDLEEIIRAVSPSCIVCVCVCVCVCVHGIIVYSLPKERK